MPNSIYSPTPQNPSYHNGPITAGTTGTVVVPAVNVPVNTSGLNGLSSADFTIANNPYLTKPRCEIKAVSSDEVSVVYHVTDEHGQQLKMVYDPEPNISAAEALKIMMLLSTMTTVSNFDALKYVRKNSLERHFKFTA